MRIWSIHPKYLDSKGLVALWRETLLAQNVLAGNTRGYKNHPQLLRFKKLKDPMQGIGSYLNHILAESKERGYRFDGSKIIKSGLRRRICVNSGQADYELFHLRKKLKVRDPDKWKVVQKVKAPDLHPVFRMVEGGIEEWEIT